MAFFSLENQYIYNLISDYYENPTLYKIKDEENDSSKAESESNEAQS